MNGIRLGAHIPWAQIELLLDKVLSLGLVPEVALKGPELDSLDTTLLDRVRRMLSAAGVRP